MVKTVLVDWSPMSNKRPVVLKKPSSVKVKAFIQARKTSTRLPNKIYEPIAGAPLLYHVIDRVGSARLIDEVIVCAPHHLEDIPEGIGLYVHPGDEKDVLSRFFACYKENQADYIVRITSDCPLLDPGLIEVVVNEAVKNKADYCSNVLRESFPDGVDCEVISRRLLCFLHATVEHSLLREHVTLAARENKSYRKQFNYVSVESVKDYSDIKWSVDDRSDLERVRGMF